MKKPKDTQAFSHVESGSHGVSFVTEGMTLRDYFAGQALSSVLSMYFKLELTSSKLGKKKECSDSELLEKIARDCYEHADAMLKEREKHVTI